jgi:glucan phosphoethanolaminetransferase (alkaline phosphatase superfamily)
MRKFIERQLDTSFIKTSLSFALIYCLFFNSSVALYKFDYYKVSIVRALFELLKDFVYVYISIVILFVGLGLHRALFIAGSILLFLTGAVASYYLFFFKIAPTTMMMPAIFGTHPSEAYELLSIRLIVWIIFSIFICVYSLKHFDIQTPKLFLMRILSAICLLLTINNVISPYSRVLNTYFPLQYLHNSYKYFAGSKHREAKIDISKTYEFVSNYDEDITGILVIGESARYDHFGINGYERNTTPMLEEIKDLASFKGRSCASLTYLSVPCMLSRHGEDNIDLTSSETGLLSVLTSLGFNTSWIGTQSLNRYYQDKMVGTFYNEVNFVIVPGGSALYLPNDYDGVMLPFIEQMASSSGKKFIVVHTTGSHWNYSLRYTQDFNKFTPICGRVVKSDPSSCSSQELVNIYDNSILYTDFFLHSLINLVKDKNAFLIYASDHAESLGEEGRFGHSNPHAPEQREIPFMVWVSEDFKKNNPEYAEAIKTHLQNDVSHDHIFHTVLDCLGVSSEVIDKSLSLCRQSV